MDPATAHVDVVATGLANPFRLGKSASALYVTDTGTDAATGLEEVSSVTVWCVRSGSRVTPTPISRSGSANATPIS